MHDKTVQAFFKCKGCGHIQFDDKDHCCGTLHGENVWCKVEEIGWVWKRQGRKDFDKRLNQFFAFLREIQCPKTT